MVAPKLSRNSEIDQFNRAIYVTVGEDDIFGLDISMHYVPLV